jgi:hypothetical protein
MFLDPDGQIVDYDYSQNQLVLTSITSSGDTATATYIGTEAEKVTSTFIDEAASVLGSYAENLDS